MTDLPSLVHLLGEILGQVVGEQESAELFETEERIRTLAKARRAGAESASEELGVEVASLSIEAARGVASAFTLYFDLVNLAEEAQRVRALQDRAREQYPEPIGESIGEALETLKNRGLTSEQVARLLSNLHIELVLTAHPTEAKRRSVLSKLQRISDILRVFTTSDPVPGKRAAYERHLAAEITALELTQRTRTLRPAVTDEVRTGLYFLDAVFWEALPRLYDDLDQALATFYPDVHAPSRWLTLASWIGGDRDGNPNVTAEVTAETLRLHRGLAVERHRRALQDLSRRLSLSAQRVPPPTELQAWLDSQHPLPPHVAYLEKRYANEPYRLVLSLLASNLESASQVDMTAHLLEARPHQARAQLSDILDPLVFVTRAIPHRLAQDQLQTVRRQLDIFGLHAAKLDLREHSSRLTSAVAEIIRAIKIDLHFEEADDQHRTRLLLRLLSESQRPATLAMNPGVTAETAETWALFRLIARARNIYGRELLGPFIISMAHHPSDILAALLLARWAGCDQGLSIVPLFETIDDLEAAPRILADLFSMEPYRAHLETCDREQMVMIGYSDSNKDGGYLSSNWALYHAQEEIAEVCAEHAIPLTLFHGRGGTVARGGGPANRAIRAQPPGTIKGRFRLTEQGETIVSRYSDPDLAHRHLEQIASAVILASAPDSPSAGPAVRPEWRAGMQSMSSAAGVAYRALVYETPGFGDYWQAATPVAEIGRLTIGSRPSSRTGSGWDIRNIRAIPWVFSWMQSRFNLPGWYGLGTALKSLHSPGRLKEMHKEWPFFRAMLDNAEMSLLKADLGIASLYSALVPDRELAKSIFDRIRKEYELACGEILALTGNAGLMDAEPVIQRSIQLRNPYVDPLNYIQVEMLKRLRALRDQESPEAEALREVIYITINGIAAGLRNTG